MIYENWSHAREQTAPTKHNGLVPALGRLLAFLCLIVVAHSAAAQETVVYYHTDALGSPVAVTDASGNVIERSEYEPYGQLLNRPLEDGPGYTGHVSDAATGLSYMQQRYYDPGIGRFLSVDPVTANPKNGSNFNRYWYANNNPYKFLDPDGRVTVKVEMNPEERRKYKGQIQQFTRSVKRTEKNLFKAGASEATKFKATTFVISTKALPDAVIAKAGANAQNIMGYEVPSGVGDNVTHLTANIFDMGNATSTMDSYAGRPIGKGSESNLTFGYLHEWRHDFPENGELMLRDANAGEQEANRFADGLLPTAMGDSK